MRRLFGSLAIALALMAPRASLAEVHVVTTPAELAAVLAEGVAGDTLSLGPGEYGALRFRGNQTPARIRSEDPARPARLAELHLKGCAGVTVRDLHVRFDPPAGTPNHARPVSVNGCRDVTLSGLTLTGLDTVLVGTTKRGGVGYGLHIADSKDIRFEASRIRGFHRGIVISRSEGVTVTGNELTGMRSDGINVSDAARIRITGNHIHSFAQVSGMGDHSDMIQFWTRGAKRQARDIVIRGNLLHSRAGGGSQSIFMRNEKVDRGEAGREMFYRDVLIEENVILNGHTHGIFLGAAEGVTIRKNTLAQNPLAVGPRPERPLWVPIIALARQSRDVAISGNIVFAISGAEGQRDWQVENNLLIQPHSSLKPGFYGRIFQGLPGGDAAALEPYFYRPDGPAADPGLGAALLQPGG